MFHLDAINTFFNSIGARDCLEIHYKRRVFVSPVVADINNDSKMDIVIADVYRTVYATDTETETLVWFQDLGRYAPSCVTLVDIDNYSYFKGLSRECV